MNDLEPRLTEDGSYTLHSARFDECYHSVHGARSESEFIFIQAGLDYWAGQCLYETNAFVCAADEKVCPAACDVLEIGFGTGLNARLCADWAERTGCKVYYETLELYPVPPALMAACSADALLGAMHAAAWNRPAQITPCFTLHKRQVDAVTAVFTRPFDVVFFDAFSPAVQPAMWTPEMLDKVFQAMRDGGVLTTYCAKGEVRRTLQRIGFSVERLPGPAGKREILRAVRPVQDAAVNPVRTA
ncbi:MAG: tRNA (5-methylaminomethyl-2-thiouridine)(34)-methyltransferase MnmD [Bacteroidales bacterium]|nr:tRNA (5-methylaminomethyl-2-thiouridine)(34)-methyltransferase MnmD [Bacteroidales bacterium]